MQLERFKIILTGLLQGVGFRPHVYRVAQELQLTGWIKNNASGVEIEIQGMHASFFLKKMAEMLPSLARIDSTSIEPLSLQLHERGFSILESVTGKIETLISPDVSICNNCLKELFDPQSRFYLYPFLNCMHCGPRFTITKQLPYDRAQTTMSEFDWCEECQKNYADPQNRRFHAQPIACITCGPQLSIPVSEIVEHISSGKIVAIKSIGGYQLICDAYNEKAVTILRARKNRPAKPFALMVTNIKSAECIVDCHKEAKDLLTCWSRPIVLLPKCEKLLPEVIAPELSHLGVMVANTPLHYLLFHGLVGYPEQIDWLDEVQHPVLVVTSANINNEPLIIDDAIAKEKLHSIADIIVSHDRKILIRADDSVVQMVNQSPFFIRRARGSTPNPIKLAYEIPSTLAVGAYLKNTICITRGDEAFVSQHIGDLANDAAITFFHETIAHLQKILAVKPEYIAHDLHPNFYNTRFAYEYDIPKIGIQHHHAHLATVAAEHHVLEPVIGLALDGYGYGEEGEAWGGELMLLEGTHYHRLGCLSPLRQPGGDAAAKEPWRMAVSALYQLDEFFEISKRFATKFDVDILLQMLQKNLNSPLTSSCGRLFDAASAILGIQYLSQYEGQAAMILESLVTVPNVLEKGWEFQGDNLNLLPTLQSLLHCDRIVGANVFHGTLIAALVQWVVYQAQKLRIKKVLLAGGCFLNKILSEGIIHGLLVHGLIPLLPQQLPPNDGGLCLGQAWLAGNIAIKEDQCV